MTAVLGVGVTIAVVLAVDRQRRRREVEGSPLGEDVAADGWELPELPASTAREPPAGYSGLMDSDSVRAGRS